MINQLQDRIFERLLLENGIEISGGQGRILFVLWKTDHLTVPKATSSINHNIIFQSMINISIHHPASCMIYP